MIHTYCDAFTTISNLPVRASGARNVFRCLIVFWFWAPTWLPSALLTPRLGSVEVKFTFLVWSICVLEAFWDGARSDRAITSFWVYAFWDTKWLGPLRVCVTRVRVCNKHHERWIQTAWTEPVRVCVWAICVDEFGCSPNIIAHKSQSGLRKWRTHVRHCTFDSSP